MRRTTLQQIRPSTFTQPPIRLLSRTPYRQLSTTNPTQKSKANHLPPRPTLPTSEIKHVYLKGSGPGGQKINKTSSAVQLTHLPTGTVVKSQATRSRNQNETIARRLLAEKIEFAERGSESRVAKVIEWKRRRKASGTKKRRRKYRKLEEGKELDGNGTVEVVTTGAGAGTGAAAMLAASQSGRRITDGMQEDYIEDEEWEEEEEFDEVEDESENDLEDSIEDETRAEIKHQWISDQPHD